MIELIKVQAQTSLEVLVYCPKCGLMQDATDELRESLEDDLRATDIEKEITCDECEEKFLVTEITY